MSDFKTFKTTSLNSDLDYFDYTKEEIGRYMVVMYGDAVMYTTPNTSGTVANITVNNKTINTIPQYYIIYADYIGANAAGVSFYHLANNTGFVCDQLEGTYIEANLITELNIGKYVVCPLSKDKLLILDDNKNTIAAWAKDTPFYFTGEIKGVYGRVRSGDTNGWACLGFYMYDGTHTHTFGNYSYDNEYTHYRICTDCFYSEFEEHVWNGGIITKEPTYTEEGIITYTCSKCNITKNETLPKLSIVSISIAKAPNKTVYQIGESLDLTGLVVKITYNNNTTENIESGFTTSALDSGTAGEKTITVTYEGKTTTFKVTVLPLTLVSIAIKTIPSKTEYQIGETLNTAGLSLTATYSNGSTETITSGFTTSALDSSTAGEKTITVTYEGKTTSFTVQVVPATLVSIAVRTMPTKVEYQIGETLDTAGLTLTATYSNGVTRTVSSGFTTSALDSSTSGQKTITVTYEDKTTTFTVKVLPLTLVSIAVKTMPSKTEYQIGEALNTAGLALTATYSNGSTETITSGFTTSALDSGTPGTKTITVTDEGKTVTFTVTVIQAVDPNAPAVEVESVSSSAGKEISVKVYLRNNPGVSYMRLTPSYDKSVLTLTGLDFTGAEAVFDVPDFDPETDRSILLESKNNVTASGFVFTMKFKIANDAPEGTYQITLTCREAYDIDETSVSFNSIAGSVNVIAFIYGDVNGDGVIDGRDIIRIRKFLSAYDDETGESPYEIFPGADCNGDGKIDGRDLIRLRKYIASYDDETGTSPIVLGP